MKKYFGLGAMIGILWIPIIFTGCASDHSENSYNASSFSGGACLKTLESGAKPIYDYLQPKCASCHFQGSAAAPSGYFFADPNFQTALGGFANLVDADRNKLYAKAYDPTHFGGSGPQNASVMDPLKDAFFAAADDYQACKAQQIVGPGGEAPPDLNPTVITTAKTIPANPQQGTNIQWDLGTEIATGSPLAGAQFQITIQAVTSSTGKTQYWITSPRARGATAGAIHIRNIRVFINNSLIALDSGGATWISLNNLAPSSRLHPLASGTGVMIVQADTSVATNTIAIGFGSIGVSQQYPDFNPTTYARLTAANNNNNNSPAERVFNQKCFTCHTGQGEAVGVLNLAANQLQQLKGSGRVVPFRPDLSLIYIRMSLDQNNPSFMPKNGTRVVEDIRWVRDWILDGAP